MEIIIHVVNTRRRQFSNYCYLVEEVESRKAILIDPSWNEAVFEKIIKEQGIKLEAVLLTHSHVDHTNLANYFAVTFDVPVFISQIEVVSYNFQCNNLQCIFDGNILNLANIPIRCILTAGHTRGSMSYLIGENLFVGDTVFYEGCGNCTYGEESINQMYNSIQKIIAIGTDKYRIYSGHVYNKMVGQALGNIKKDNICFLLNKHQFMAYMMNQLEKDIFSTKQL